MYTTCCLMVIYPCAKFGILMTKIKHDLAQTQIHSEKIILIEAIGQGHTEVMNVSYTSSMATHSFAKYGITMSKAQKSYWPYMNLQRQMDTQ